MITIYALLGISVLFASLNSTLLHKAAIKKTGEIYLFNLIGSVVWVIMLLILSTQKLPQFDIASILWGFLYGIVQFLFVFFKTRAMSSGDVSVTTLIGNCSLIVSLVVSSIVWKEQISTMQIVGVALLMFSILLCVQKKSSQGYSKIWLIYSVFFFIFAAGVGIVFKTFSKCGQGADTSAMMICSALVMTVAYFLASILTKTKKKDLKLKINLKTFLMYAIASGILSCGYNRMNISLSGSLPAIIFFPGFNGGVILISALLSRVVCAEKFSTKKVVSLMLGAISILIIGIF